MTNETLRSDLESADPAHDGDDSNVHELVLLMAARARDTATAAAPAPARWWKRRRVLVPLGIAGIAALTGAAVILPLDLWVNGTQVELDAEVPITYVTDTGVEVSCRYGFYFGDPLQRTAADERLAEFVNDHDWTGIGQRIYDSAIANPFVPGADDEWQVDTQEVRDGFSFGRATQLIWDEIPWDLRIAGQSAAGSSDCTGQLH